MGILTFTVVVTGWSLAIGLAITLIGLPIALLTVALSRAMAAVERRRAQLVLGAPLEARYRSWTQGSVWKRLRSVFADPTTWKDLAWHLLLLPVGIAGFAIAATTWSTTAGLLLMPAWWWIGHDGWAVDLGLFSIDGWPEAFAGTGIGLLSVPLTIALVRGSAAGTGALARIVLGPGTRALEERVETLTATRAGASTPRRSSSRALSATCTTARRRASSRSPWTSGWPSSRLAATPGPPRSSSAARARTPARRWSSCASWRAGCAPRSSPSAGWARR
jgi:putative sensor protein